MFNKAFAPHTRAQDERTIVRTQRDFSAGMFANMAKQNIPINGVSYLKNFKNYGNRLEGRRGSRRWVVYNLEVHGNLPANGNLNASYYSKYHNKIFLLIDSVIWVSSDETCNPYEWKIVSYQSFQVPDNSDSEFDELNDDIILRNSNGIYRIEQISSYPYEDKYIAYKINSDIPKTKITTDLTDNTYNYRYIVSMSKSKYDDNIYDNNRTNTVFKVDSGTTASISGNTDYVNHYRSSVIGSGSFNVLSGLTVPYISGSNFQEQHWDYYSVWRTKDLGINGTDSQTGVGNNSDLYIWVGDIPTCRVFTAEFCSGHSNPEGRDLDMMRMDIYPGYDNTIGISDFDIGTPINMVSGNSIVQYNITSIQNSVIIDGTPNYDGKGKYFTISGQSYPDYGTQSILFYGTVSGGNVTKNGNLLSTSGGFSVSDIGTCITDVNGHKARIYGISGTSGIVNTATDFTSGPACWGLTTRNFNDRVEDTTLDSRISAYPCYQRLYENIQDGNTGVIAPGFIFSAPKGSNFIDYAQIADGYDSLIGYHHPLYQTIYVKDGISCIRKLPDKVVLYSNASTTVVPINITSSVTIDSIGVDITTIAGQTEIDDHIGVIADKSIQSIDNGLHLVITNEPALRIFDGEKYGNNLSYPYISEILPTLGTDIISSYDPTEGYTFWAKNRCFNYAMGTPDSISIQGIGFSEYTGNYPYPQDNGCLRITDSNDIIRSIIIDKDDDYFYDITTRLYPSYNSSVSLTPSYKDKVTVTNGVDTGGYEITPEVTFRSDIGDSSNFIIEHDSSDFQINRTYGSSVLSTTFEVHSYADSKYDSMDATQSFLNNNKNKLKTVIFDKKIEGNEIYTVITASTSNFCINEREQRYFVKDINYGFEYNDSGEMDHQLNLSNPLLWWTIQGQTPLIDRVSGLTVSGMTISDGKFYREDGITPMLVNSDISFKLNRIDINDNVKIILPETTYSGNKTLFFITTFETSSQVSTPSGSYTNTHFWIDQDNIGANIVSGISGNGSITIKAGSISTADGYIADIRVYAGTKSIEDLVYLGNDLFYNYGYNTISIE